MTIALAMLACFTGLAARPGDRHFVNVEGLRCRLEPDLNVLVQTTVSRGRELFGLERDGPWVRVAVDGAGGIRIVCGWVFGRYIRAGPGAEAPPAI